MPDLPRGSARAPRSLPDDRSWGRGHRRRGGVTGERRDDLAATLRLLRPRLAGEHCRRCRRLAYTAELARATTTTTRRACCGFGVAFRRPARPRLHPPAAEPAYPDRVARRARASASRRSRGPSSADAPVGASSSAGPSLPGAASHVRRSSESGQVVAALGAPQRAQQLRPRRRELELRLHPLPERGRERDLRVRELEDAPDAGLVAPLGEREPLARRLRRLLGGAERRARGADRRAAPARARAGPAAGAAPACASSAVALARASRTCPRVAPPWKSGQLSVTACSSRTTDRSAFAPGLRHARGHPEARSVAALERADGQLLAAHLLLESAASSGRAASRLARGAPPARPPRPGPAGASRPRSPTGRGRSRRSPARPGRAPSRRRSPPG